MGESSVGVCTLERGYKKQEWKEKDDGRRLVFLIPASIYILSKFF